MYTIDDLILDLINEKASLKTREFLIKHHESGYFSPKGQESKLLQKIAKCKNIVLFFDPDEEDFGLAKIDSGDFLNTELIGPLHQSLIEMKKRCGSF